MTTTSTTTNLINLAPSLMPAQSAARAICVAITHTPEAQREELFAAIIENHFGPQQKQTEELLAKAHFALIEAKEWNWLDEAVPPPEDIQEQIARCIFEIKGHFRDNLVARGS